jgi:putative membrane protein
MVLQGWLWPTLSAMLLSTWTIFYLYSWQRLRRRHVELASVARLILFAIGITALALAVLWPLPAWSHYLLSMRSAQKVMVGMVAPIFLWLACPFHIIAVASPLLLRLNLARLLRSKWRASRLLRKSTHPLAAWILFVGVFLMWHDPFYTHWALPQSWNAYLAPWILHLVALLFWWHVIGTGPRLHHLSGGLLLLYLIAVEVPNMVAGITIAFTREQIYPYYGQVRAALAPGESLPLPLSLMNDQIIGGAIIWVFGSMVYITSILGVLLRMFQQDGSMAPEPLQNWDDDERFIAPGLEHRAAQKTLPEVEIPPNRGRIIR